MNAPPPAPAEVTSEPEPLAVEPPATDYDFFDSDLTTLSAEDSASSFSASQETPTIDATPGLNTSDAHLFGAPGEGATDELDTIGGGMALGREGPIVHASSAIASRLGRFLFKDPERIRAMIPVGMAAGIGAAFNAPLSAITFVFEELLDNFSTKAIGGMIVAVIIASVVSRTLLGEQPVISHHLLLHYETAGWLLVALPLGLLAGCLGH